MKHIRTFLLVAVVLNLACVAWNLSLGGANTAFVAVNGIAAAFALYVYLITSPEMMR